MIKLSAIFIGNNEHWIHDKNHQIIKLYSSYSILNTTLTFNADLFLRFVFIPLSKLFLFLEFPLNWQYEK